MNGSTNYGYSYKPIATPGMSLPSQYSQRSLDFFRISSQIPLWSSIGSIPTLFMVFFHAFIPTKNSRIYPSTACREAERPGAPLPRGAPRRWDQRRLLPQRAAAADGRPLRAELPAPAAEGGDEPGCGTGVVVIPIYHHLPWGYPKVFIRENPTKMDDLEVPPFMETPTCCN